MVKYPGRNTIIVWIKPSKDILWMVKKSCTTKRMVETQEMMGETIIYQVAQDFATIHSITN